MANRPLTKWFIRIVSVIMAVNILLVAVSACLVPGMDRLVYTRSGEDACIVQLDFENRQVRYMRYTSTYDNQWMVGEMSGFMAVRLKFAAALAAAPLWFKSYSGTENMDADAWGMDMYFGNRFRTCQGNGDAPLSYKILISKIVALAEAFPTEAPRQPEVPGNVAAAEV